MTKRILRATFKIKVVQSTVELILSFQVFIYPLPDIDTSTIDNSLLTKIIAYSRYLKYSNNMEVLL